MYGKFSDIPFFLINKYFNILAELDSLSLTQMTSCLIGPKTSIVTKGAPVQEMFVRDEGYGYRPVWLTPVSNTENEFTVLKSNRYLPSSNYITIEGDHYSFVVYDNDLVETFIEDGDELYFRKDSPFYTWLKNGASDYISDEIGSEFILRNYVNTDKDFIFFGKIFNKSYRENLYGIEYYSLKDFMVDAVPPHQRTTNFKEFLRKYADYVLSEPYTLQKNIFSLIDPFTIDYKYLNHLTSVCGLDIDDLDIDITSKRNLAHELINLLKSKGSFLALKYLWKLVTNNTLNIINFYEIFHDKSLSGFIDVNDREEIPWYGYYGIESSSQDLYYQQWTTRYHNYEYPEDLSVKTLATQYKVEIDLTKEPIHETEIFNKSLADKIYKYWEFYRPINRVADYNIFVSPITDLSAKNIGLYSGEKEAYLTSRSYVRNITLPRTFISFFRPTLENDYEYIIEHNLNSRNVLIQLFTFDLKLINPEIIEYIDNNNVKVRVVYDRQIFALIKRPSYSAFKEEGTSGSDLGTKYYVSDFIKNSQYETPESFEVIDEYEYNISPVDLEPAFSKNIYIHNQNTPSDTWYINHSMGSNLIINAYDNNNNKIYPNEIYLASSSQAIAYFEEEVYGYAVVSLTDELNVYHSMGSVTDWTINHALGSSKINVHVYDLLGYEIIPNGVEIVDDDNVRLTFEEDTTVDVIIRLSDNNSGPVTNWVIEHNINQKEIFTQFSNSANMGVVPSYVELTDVNFLETTLNGGYAILGQNSYVHYQSTASSIWTVTHNFGYSGCLVNTYDSNNEKVYPKDIELLDDNSLRIVFDKPISGYAVLVSVGSPFFTEISKSTKVKFSNNDYSEVYETAITDFWDDSDYAFYRLDIPRNVELTINRIEILTDADERVFLTECSDIHKSKYFTLSVLYRIYKGAL